MKNPLYTSIFLLFVSFFLVSCGRLNDTKPAPGDKEGTSPELVRISKLESNLLDARQDKENLTRQLEDKETVIQQLQETVSALEKEISGLKKKTLALTSVQGKIDDTTPADLYKKARNLLLEENYLPAAALFIEFMKNHPKDDLADNAAYWLGECHYSLGEYKQAISVFKDLIAAYPKSEKVPDAILKTGYSYLSLEDSNRAHHYLKQVLKKYPFSLAAEKAQEKLRSFE